MAISLASITQQTALRAPRVLLLGVEKIGKTTFSVGTRFDEEGKVVETGLNKPIILPLKGEEGADGLGIPAFPKLGTYADILDAVASLFETDAFDTVVIDSVSQLIPIICEDVCRSEGVDNIRKVKGFRTGEAAVMNRLTGLLDALDHLRDQKNVTVILIGHVRVKKFKNPEGDDYDTYDLDLEDDLKETLKRRVDLIMFANTHTIVMRDGQDSQFGKAKRTARDPYEGKPFLYTKKTPTHPGGGRTPYGQLPSQIPLHWPDFKAELDKLSVPNNNTNKGE